MIFFSDTTILIKLLRLRVMDSLNYSLIFRAKYKSEFPRFGGNQLVTWTELPEVSCVIMNGIVYMKKKIG